MGRPLTKRPAEKVPDADAPSESPERPRGHGPRPQQLPMREVDWTLPEAERRCATCQGELTEIRGQHEESEEITVVQRQFVLLTHRRQKYRCRCEATVVTAPGPPKLIPGGRYSVDFAVEVAASKYLDHRVPRMRTKMPQGGKGSNAAEEMRGGPSESGCRTRLHTTSRCAGQEPAW
jgi:transposase